MDAEFHVTPEEIEDACRDPLPPLVLRGLELFNEGEYFEAHEVLETAWRAEPRPVRELYRGILQIAVAYYHIQHGNYRGAVKLFLRSRTWLSPFPAQCCGIDLARFRQDYTRVEDTLTRLGPDELQHFDTSLFKPILYRA
jgi:predicted metal-dependent hydrolase